MSSLGKTTISIKVDDMSFEELSLLMQGLCNKANALREQIRYLQRKIDERIQKMPDQQAHKLRLAANHGQAVSGASIGPSE